MRQKLALVSTSSCTLSMSSPPSSGNARSTWITLPNDERLEPSRRPTPTSFSNPVALQARDVGAPGAAHVEERRRADVEQPERVPLRVVALLERQQRARRAGLVAQRITAQAVVAAEQQLRLFVEVLGDRARDRGVELAVLRGWPVEAALGTHDAILHGTVLDPARRGQRAEHRLPGIEVRTVLHVGARDQRVAVGAGGLGGIADPRMTRAGPRARPRCGGSGPGSSRS